METEYEKKRILKNLTSVEYEHPFDKTALNALRGTPGIEALVRKFNEYSIDKLLKVQYTGSNVKVNSKNFPQLYRAVNTACDVLDVKKVPDIYLNQGFINAFTAGVEKPIIVLNTNCIDYFNYDELLYVIGHEIGHIKSEHVLFHQMASVIPTVGGIIGSVTLGFGNLITTGLQAALLNWKRKSEYTADRAGLLACQNVDCVISAMTKIAGYPPKYHSQIDPQDFLLQAKEFEGYDEDDFDKAAKFLSVLFADHPWAVMRGAEISKWIESGAYSLLLNKYSDETATEDQMVCENCSKNNPTGNNFCSRCGTKLVQ